MHQEAVLVAVASSSRRASAARTTFSMISRSSPFAKPARILLMVFPLSRYSPRGRYGESADTASSSMGSGPSVGEVRARSHSTLRANGTRGRFVGIKKVMEEATLGTNGPRSSARRSAKNGLRSTGHSVISARNTWWASQLHNTTAAGPVVNDLFLTGQ
jgi:hypothetical protein